MTTSSRLTGYITAERVLTSVKRRAFATPTVDALENGARDIYLADKRTSVMIFLFSRPRRRTFFLAFLRLEPDHLLGY